MLLFTYPNEGLDNLDDEGAIAAIAPVVGDRAREVYGIYAQSMPDASPTVRLAAMLTARFRFGSIRLAERKSALHEAPIWMYRFDFETDVEDSALGAPHAIDVAFTFGNPDVTPLSGSRPERFAMADLACGAWGAFARHGTRQSHSSQNGRPTTTGDGPRCCSTSNHASPTTPNRRNAKPGMGSSCRLTPAGSASGKRAVAHWPSRRLNTPLG